MRGSTQAWTSGVELRQRQNARLGGGQRPPDRTPSPVRRQPPQHRAQPDTEGPPLRVAKKKVHDGPGPSGCWMRPRAKINPNGYAPTQEMWDAMTLAALFGGRGVEGKKVKGHPPSLQIGADVPACKLGSEIKKSVFY